MKKRKCTKCLLPKPLDEFHKDRRAKSGLSSHCKACARRYEAAGSKVRHTAAARRAVRARKAENARKAAALEVQVASFRPVSLAIASEIVYDRSLRDDCVQEALIRAWEILRSQPDASRPYIHKAIKCRIMDISMRQTFTGHTGQRGTLTDPLRRPHNSIDAMLDLGWEPTQD